MEEERSYIHTLNAFRLFSMIVDNIISARHREKRFANSIYTDGIREKVERQTEREEKTRKRKEDKPKKSDTGKEE